MQPDFYQIGGAIHSTLDYYKIEKIKPLIGVLAGTESNPQVYKDLFDTVFILQERMEAEINQTIHTSSHNTLVYLFENLKIWLKNPLISDVHVPTIEMEIDLYNEREHERLEKKVKDSVQYYQKNYGHLKENEEFEYTDPNPFGMLIGSKYLTYKTNKTYHKIYCIEERTDYIDKSFLEDYVVKINGIVSNLRRILTHYVRLYDQDKFRAHDIRIVESASLKEPAKQKVIENGESSRLRLNMTVEQLVMLFRLLKEVKLIEAKFDKEIHAFIAENFETTNRPGIKFSVENIKKLWSSKEPDTLNYWIARLKELNDKIDKK